MAPRIFSPSSPSLCSEASISLGSIDFGTGAGLPKMALRAPRRTRLGPPTRTNPAPAAAPAAFTGLRLTLALTSTAARAPPGPRREPLGLRRERISNLRPLDRLPGGVDGLLRPEPKLDGLHVDAAGGDPRDQHADVHGERDGQPEGRPNTPAEVVGQERADEAAEDKSSDQPGD